MSPEDVRLRRWRGLAVAGLVTASILVVTVSLLILSDVAPVTFDGTYVAVYCSGTYCPATPPPPTQFIPRGANVSVTWTDEGGATVTFSIQDPNFVSVCREQASSGYCDFKSIGALYLFRVSLVGGQSTQSVDYSGSYAAVPG